MQRNSFDTKKSYNTMYENLTIEPNIQFACQYPGIYLIMGKKCLYFIIVILCLPKLFQSYLAI